MIADEIFDDKIKKILDKSELILLLSHALLLLKDFRNVSAHGGRVYNHNSINTIKIKKNSKYLTEVLGLKPNQIRNGYGREGLGAVMDFLSVVTLKNMIVNIQTNSIKIFEDLQMNINKEQFDQIMKDAKIPNQRLKTT